MINLLWDLNTPPAVLPAISAIVAETAVFPTTVDLFTAFNAGETALIQLGILTGATAPGAGVTVTMWAAFCPYAGRTPAELTPLAVSIVCPVPNAANTRRVFSVPGAQQGARYLYLWFDHTVQAAGSILTLNPSVSGKTN